MPRPPAGTPADTDPYPHDLAGDPADPPQAAPEDFRQAWREYEAGERQLLEDAGPIFSAGTWRMAPALQQLLQEADAANPGRDKTSDGGIGDARHQARTSDHNPDARGVVCARDFDVDGLDVPAAFERMRQAVLVGRLPQLVGGYLISNGRMTTPSFDGWVEYDGENPHVTHGHVSVAHDPERADDRRPWNVWTAARPAPARPAPATPPSNGSDLRGRSVDLRGEQGAAGPRVAALQAFLRRYAPRYARGLVVDGVWGPRTSAVVREFALRSGVRDADGLNIGPQIARKLTVAGFRG